ncbi:MAG: hypothetical protein Q8O88_04160 [bacterium]|nr:hypothetical protein [bacterium]
MEGKFSVGDTVSFSWNGYKMTSFILSSSLLYFYPATLIPYIPFDKKLFYVVEINFKRNSARDYFESSFENGICNESENNLSTCRIVLIEKTNRIFSNYVT